MNQNSFDTIKSALDFLNLCAYKFRCHEAGFIRDHEWDDCQAEMRSAYLESSTLKNLVDREVNRDIPFFKPELLAVFLKE